MPLNYKKCGKIQNSSAPSDFAPKFEYLRSEEQADIVRMYLQPNYSNWVFGNIYISAGQHQKVNIDITHCRNESWKAQIKS